MFTLIIHGGAWDIPENMHKAHTRGIENALEHGYKCLCNNYDALHSVIEVVKILEADATFDAGRGSFLNAIGEVEMDAIVMSGKDLSAGAVAAIQNIAHPVEAAELVRTRTEHLMLAGSGATMFAHKNGLDPVNTEDLVVGRELKRYRELKKKEFKTREFFEESPGRDTVGAVAFDDNGDIAVATSTGGTPNKLSGRIGDSPIIGAGAFADNLSGGASSTGWGESLMKVLSAKDAVDRMSRGCAVKEAADDTIKYLHERVDGRGGVICIDTSGKAGFAYNTPYMARGIADQDGIKHIGI